MEYIILLTLLLIASGYCDQVESGEFETSEIDQHRAILPHQDEVRNLEDEYYHPYEFQNLDDTVKAIWLDKDKKKEEKPKPKEYEKKKEPPTKDKHDRDTFSHHQPPPKYTDKSHYQSKPEYEKYNNKWKKPVKEDLNYQNSKHKYESYYYNKKTTTTTTTKAPKLLNKFSKKKDDTHKKDYIDVKSLDARPESEYSYTESSVTIADVKSELKGKDTLILVVKIPKLPSLSPRDIIQLPPFTLDFNKHKWTEKLNHNLNWKQTTSTPFIGHSPPEHPPTEQPPSYNYTTEQPPKKYIFKNTPYATPPYPKPYPRPPYTTPRKPEYGYKAPQHKWDHLPYYNWDQVPYQSWGHGEPKETWIHGSKQSWNNKNSEYLNIGEEPVLLFDAPVHDFSNVDHINWDKVNDGEWVRVRRSVNDENIENTAEETFGTANYQGELPPIQFPKLKKPGTAVPHHDIDAPLFFPTTDDKILGLVNKSIYKKKSTTTTSKSTIENRDTESNLLFPKNLKLISQYDDSAPTYFPENEAELDYIRQFQKESNFDKSISEYSLVANPSLSTSVSDETIVAANGIKKKMLPSEENQINLNENMKYFLEPKPPLYFPQNKEELKRYNEIYNRKMGAHRNIPLYKKHKHEHQQQIKEFDNTL